MKQFVRISQLGEYMSRHFVDVFDSVLGLPATPAPKVAAPPAAARVSATVGFVGEAATGAVYVHFSEAYARRVTAVMLGLTTDDLISPGEVNDVIGEIANILAGGLKSYLHDLGAPSALSASAIIRGTSYLIEPLAEVEREVLIFESENEFVSVEIHLKPA
ncbi:MAG: chemotaxis protein CheX [Verrucomicrobiota bacterium]